MMACSSLRTAKVMERWEERRRRRARRVYDDQRDTLPFHNSHIWQPPRSASAAPHIPRKLDRHQMGRLFPAPLACHLQLSADPRIPVFLLADTSRAIFAVLQRYSSIFWGSPDLADFLSRVREPSAQWEQKGTVTFSLPLLSKCLDVADIPDFTPVAGEH